MTEWTKELFDKLREVVRILEADEKNHVYHISRLQGKTVDGKDVVYLDGTALFMMTPSAAETQERDIPALVTLTELRVADCFQRAADEIRRRAHKDAPLPETSLSGPTTST